MSVVVLMWWMRLQGVDRDSMSWMDRWVVAVADWPRLKVVPGAAPGFFENEPFEHKPFPQFKVFRMMMVLFGPVLLVFGWRLKRQREKVFFDRLSIDQRDGPDKERAISLIAWFVRKSKTMMYVG